MHALYIGIPTVRYNINMVSLENNILYRAKVESPDCEVLYIYIYISL